MNGHALLEKHLKTAVLLLLLALPLASAFSVETSTHNLGITSCSDGKAYVYVKNQFTKDATLSFSGSFGELQGHFDASSQTIPAGTTRGTFVHVGSSQCFRGTQDITVYAQLCVDDECRVENADIRVFVAPCADCGGNYYTANATESYYTPAKPRLPDGAQRLESSIYFSTQFDQSYYQVDVFGKGELNLRVGDDARVDLAIVNRGAAGTFDLRLIGDVGEVEAYLYDDYISLARGGEKTVVIDVSPRTATGKYCLALQALHLGILVQEKYVCFNVYDKLSATVVVPTTLSAKRCVPLSYSTVIQNTGSASDTYHFTVKGARAVVSEPYITLAPSERGEITIEVDSNALALGRNAVELKIEGENLDALTGQTVKGRGTTSVLAKECPPITEPAVKPKPQISGVESSQEANGTLIKVTVKIANEGNTPTNGVKADVLGLPEDWSVTPQEPDGVTIPSNSTKNVTLWVQAASPQEVEGTLVVSAEGKTLFEKPIKVNGATGSFGIVGFFVLALSQNLLFISVLILFALLVIVLAARKKHQADIEEAKLEKVKQSISEEAD
ncbi:MAG: hypothetical protein ACE5DI_02090 [Candidatus Micrarchaeia archaeon]